VTDLDGGTATARLDLIRLRRGTAKQWADTNPWIVEGEETVETDTGIRKRGPAGGAYYNDLPDSGSADIARLAAGPAAALAIVFGV
jgi:hypothetical protein